ncbi:MAG: ATP-dependent DNA helicase RecG [Chloroflexi bacterium]|nr:ATP-dependent DNA helicase RecG [Chloroflexota bacterium]
MQPPAGAPSAPQAPRRPPSPSADAFTQAGINAPLTVLPGIGKRQAQTLTNLGLQTLGDLLYYFPRRYDDYSRLTPINRLNYGDECTIIAGVQSSSTRPVSGGRYQLTEVVVSDGTGFLRLTWFNQPWIKNQLKAGDQIVFSGKVDMYLGRLVMTNPEWEPLDQQQLHTNRIVPVYPLTAHISQRWLRKIMYQTVNFWASRMADFLPQSVRQNAQLLDLGTALQQVHFPDSLEMLKAGRSRLAFDEIFQLQIGVLRQKRNWQAGTAAVFQTSEEALQKQMEQLPFALTGAQKKVLDEIRQDLQSGQPMNRLLQGDVGSGKTIIAALAAAMVAQHGAQAAFMAPTSILAEQHYRNLCQLLTSLHFENQAEFTPEQIRLLLGDTPEAEKNDIRENLANGNIKVIIGTHALIEDPIEFHSLQLVVVDEQHRFGVEQRAALRVKGENPHLLVMTATPIPRSLALTLYGDLDLSVLDEMPAGRQPIETHVLHPLERERAYHLIRTEVQKGHQAFIIYPLIEKGDRDEGKAAVEEKARLEKEVFPHLKLGLLHGRLKPEEKEQVMTLFRNGEYPILVSTSVVEVGVDVPNATVMLVEGANRFGLAQLHQFRGRVGRGEAQSYCLLIPETEDSLENERLAAMAETNDGFVLAERDLGQRGPGDFLGTRQSGYAELKMAKLTDIGLIEKARQQAQALFEKDPDLELPEHAELEKMVKRFWEGGKGDIS